MFPENNNFEPDVFERAVEEVSRNSRRESREKVQRKEEDLREKDELVGKLYSSLSKSPEESLKEELGNLGLDFETDYRDPDTVLKEERPDVYREISDEEIMERYDDADSVVLQLFLCADLDRELPEVLSSKRGTRELYRRIKEVF
ncbi:MAG: hypothetical protein ACLFTQ_00195 [Candidatus Aenigmatarchaeota archaeon]